MAQAGGYRVSKDPDSWIAGKEAGDYQNDAWLKAHDPIKCDTSASPFVEGESAPVELSKAA
jgi:hypothetical protein